MSNPPSGEFNPDIGRYNDEIAGIYDRATQAEGWAVNDLVAEAINDQRLTHVHTALDLGAGTGQTIDLVERVLHPQSITAVDASRRMLDQLRSKFPQPHIQTTHRTIEDYVDGHDQEFDLITAIGSFEFVKDLPQVLGKLALLLAPRGTMLFTYIPQTEPTISQRTFQVPSLKAAFTEYYWPTDIIEAALLSSGLAIAAKKRVPAYERGPETVTYEFITALQPSASEA